MCNPVNVPGLQALKSFRLLLANCNTKLYSLKVKKRFNFFVQNFCGKFQLEKFKPKPILVLKLRTPGACDRL